MITTTRRPNIERSKVPVDRQDLGPGSDALPGEESVRGETGEVTTNKSTLKLHELAATAASH